MQDRRTASRFTEKISLILIIISSIGAILILVDPIIAWQTPGGMAIKFGGGGFSDQLKGAVVMLMLIGGFTAVVNFWLGASDQGKKQIESISRIAEQAAPTQAAAVAAATGMPPPEKSPIVTDTVNVEATTANATETKP